MASPDFLDGGHSDSLLLAWSGRSSSFALHAVSVGRIVEEREWLDADVRDLTEVLDLDDSLEPVRILDVRGGGGRLGLRTFGAMRLCRVAPDDLLDVPPLLRASDVGARRARHSLRRAVAPFGFLRGHRRGGRIDSR
jgi:hypothetical protein